MEVLKISVLTKRIVIEYQEKLEVRWNVVKEQENGDRRKMAAI